MSAAAMSNYNQELVNSIEELRRKKDDLDRDIAREEEEKQKVQKDLNVLSDRLNKLNESLVKKSNAKIEYEKTIQETEAAYMKILESSQTLLHVINRENVNLDRRHQ